jgi:hypothetical protein
MNSLFDDHRIPHGILSSIITNKLMDHDKHQCTMFFIKDTFDYQQPIHRVIEYIMNLPKVHIAKEFKAIEGDIAYLADLIASKIDIKKVMTSTSMKEQPTKKEKLSEHRHFVFIFDLLAQNQIHAVLNYNSEDDAISVLGTSCTSI